MLFYGLAYVGLEALEHFESAALSCPTLENPADFFLDMITVDPRTPEAKETSQQRVTMLHEAWEPIEKEQLGFMAFHPSSLTNENLQIGQTTSRWPVTMPYEILVLMERNFKTQFRDLPSLIGQLLENIIIVLLLSFIFFQMPDDSFNGVQDRIGLLFFVPINLTFTIAIPLVVVFAIDRAIILRERYSATYRVSSAYIAKYLSLLPLRIFITIVFALILYYIVPCPYYDKIISIDRRAFEQTALRIF